MFCLEDFDRILIIKMGAAGDVVRTTPVLHLMDNQSVTWLVDAANRLLVPPQKNLRIVENVSEIEMGSDFDLVLSLEDDQSLLESVFGRIQFAFVVGTFVEHGVVRYSEEMSEWFDMSLVSRFGMDEANKLKLSNRRTYQSFLFEGLGKEFSGQEYRLPDLDRSSRISGDIAFAPLAGARWPMKNWFYFDEMINHFRERAQIIVLPQRETLLAHLADVSAYRMVVSNDSLPMHLALGLEVPCVSFFTCTSPWEIHDYDRLKKVVSPCLEEFFYSRGDNREGKAAISLEDGLAAVYEQAESFGIDLP